MKLNSLYKLSKYAGAGYLIIFATGIFSNFFVLESFTAAGDASQTAKNIIENETLFRVGFLSFFIMVIIDAALAWAFYILLKPANKNISLLAGWLRLINVSIFGIALLYLLNVLQLLSGADYLNSLEASQLYALVLLNLESFNSAWLIGLVFFGLHLLVLGYLIHKSGYIPKFIGVLLIIAAVGYLIDSFANFLLPNYFEFENIFALVVIIPGIIGELSFTFWLLIKGVRIQDSSDRI